MNERKKIFITEDEFIVAKNLESKLMHLGYEVTGIAASGEMTLHQIKNNPPDIVLMDIMLAGEIDGIETAKIIKNEFNIPVIFLTAYSSEEIYKRAAIVEPYAYIIKPYEERELEINIAITLYKNSVEKKIAKKQAKLEELNKNLDRLVEERTEKLQIEVNERKIAQELQYRFFNVIEQFSDHVIITDSRGVIEYVNSAICEYTLYEKHEVIGKRPSIFKSDLYDDSYYKKLWTTIAEGKAFSDEFVNKKKSGELYTVSQHIIPLSNLKGEITHFASVSRDLSEKKKFEEKLINVQEKERSRISRELHDGIGQTLTAIKLSVNRIVEKHELPQYEFLETNKMIDSLTASLRDISYDLMPSVLRDYGLISAMNKVVNQLKKNTSIDIDFTYNQKEHRLQKNIEISLFRIFQEGINNAVIHSRATKIEVNLDCFLNMISITISDNGKGFNFQDKMKSHGHGLRNMKYRAHLMNGIFKLDSNENGTVINIKIPFKDCEA